MFSAIIKKKKKLKIEQKAFHQFVSTSSGQLHVIQRPLGQEL